MSLFYISPKRQIMISDAYVMALTFIICFWVTRLTMKVFEKRTNRTNKVKKINNVRGGSFESETAMIILSCIEDGKSYWVKDQSLAKLIFAITKEKMRDNSIIISQNFIRYLALKLATENLGLKVKIQNVILVSDNPIRLVTRTMYAAILGIVAALNSMLPYAIFLTIIAFTSTENCGIQCDRYFSEIQQSDSNAIVIYAEPKSNNLIITSNDQAQQVEIYEPIQKQPTIVKDSDGQKRIQRTYVESRRKAKQVKFSDFRKKDPVLRKFQDLEEPNIPEKVCLLKPESLKETLNN